MNYTVLDRSNEPVRIFGDRLYLCITCKRITAFVQINTNLEGERYRVSFRKIEHLHRRHCNSNYLDSGDYIERFTFISPIH